jgi:hypothetical protein
MVSKNQVSFSPLLSRLRKAVETTAIVATIIFLTGSQAPAEEAARSGQLSIVFENDVFFRTDQHYTDGVALAWVPDGTPYTGSVVIWGGVIISVDNCSDGSSIAVLQTPLDDRDQPKDIEYSRGRFIATTPHLADPLVFGKGRRITVVGEISGKETMPIGRSALYSYPVLRIKQLVLWSLPDYLPPVYYT